MSIEHYLLASDGYSSTTLTLGFSHPLERGPISKSLQDRWESHKGPLLQMIGALLEIECGMSCGTWGVSLVSYSKPGYQRETIYQPTLIINLQGPCGQGMPPNWSVARDQIKELLKTRSIEAEVEILSKKPKSERSLFALKPDEAIRAYEIIRDRLLEIIEDNLSTAWSMICVWSIGIDTLSAEPALVVFVDPGTVKDWNTLVVNLKGIINAAIPPKSSLVIDVEFLPGGTGLLNLDTVDDEGMDEEEDENDQGGMPGMDLSSQLCKNPWMGMSIRVDGERGGGTLGGFVELDVEGTKHSGFLTNWHVVQPPRNADTAIKKASARYGTNYFSASDPTQVGLHYLAEKDVESTKEGLSHTLAKATKKLQQEEKDKDYRLLFGSKPSLGYLMRKEMLVKEIAETEEKLRLVDALPAPIGRVIVSSGRSTTEKDGLAHIIDWAFVELGESSPPLVRQNKLPPKDMILDPKVWDLPDILMVPEMATGFGKLEGGKFYYKVGRTTGLTHGICHGTQAYVPGEHIRYNERGNPVRVRDKGQATMEWILVGGPDDEKKQTSFCQPGDSGAFIIDTDGKVSGLMYGNLQNYCGPPYERKCYIGAGLATSMEVVIEAIRLKTTRKDGNGKKVASGGTIKLV